MHPPLPYHPTASKHGAMSMQTRAERIPRRTFTRQNISRPLMIYFTVMRRAIRPTIFGNNSNNFLGSSNVSVIGGINITAAIPDYQYPTLNKRLPDGTELNHQYERGDEYFDDSVPFGGIYIEYINSVVKISDGDIQNVTFTHTSKASLKRFPASSYTAAVRDVQNGLVDMAVGPLWITGQRLKMTTFTVPLGE
eukprot:scaffold3854_cov120-Skeletonema_marinoi.AAC.5